MGMRLSITAVEEAPESAPFILRGSFRDSIRTAGRIGYDAIELHIADPSLLDAFAIGQELQNAGLHLSSIGTGLGYAREGISLTSPDEDVRQHAVARIKSHIHFARNLGGAVIIGLIRGKISECGSEKAYSMNLEDSLRNCLDEAEKYGVPILLESVNHLEADFLTNAEETLMFIDSMGSESLFLLLDTYHMDIEGEPWQKTFTLAGKRLGHVHLADRDRMPPGSGGIDFAEVIRTLESIGYEGCLAVECRPVPAPLEAAEKIFWHLNGRHPAPNTSQLFAAC